MAESEGHYGLRSRSNDEQRNPHAQESRQGPEGRVNVGVVTSRPRDGGAQLRVAQGTQGWKQTARKPYYQWRTNGPVTK